MPRRRRRKRTSSKHWRPGPGLRGTRWVLVKLLGTRGGRWTTVAALLFGLIAWAYDEWVREPFPTGPTVRVAAWNLRNFSGENRDLDAIAGVIAENDFAVVALQEVRGDGRGVEALAGELNGPLSRRWRVLLSDRTGSNKERFAYLYDSDRVRHLGEAGFLTRRLDVDRRPVRGELRGGGLRLHARANPPVLQRRHLSTRGGAATRGAARRPDAARGQRRAGT